MKVLLDTHCLLWALYSPNKLNRRASSIFLNSENELLISAVVTWELAIKLRLGKLKLPGSLQKLISSLFEEGKYLGLAIEHQHALAVSNLLEHHSDPFDRLLIAQALVEQVPLMTADKNIKKYDVEVIWAS